MIVLYIVLGSIGAGVLIAWLIWRFSDYGKQKHRIKKNSYSKRKANKSKKVLILAKERFEETDKVKENRLEIIDKQLETDQSQKEGKNLRKAFLDGCIKEKGEDKNGKKVKVEVKAEEVANRVRNKNEKKDNSGGFEQNLHIFKEILEINADPTGRGGLAADELREKVKKAQRKIKQILGEPQQTQNSN